MQIDLVTKNEVIGLENQIDSLKDMVKLLISMQRDVAIDLEEASKLCGFSDQTLSNAIRAGKLKAENDGGRGNAYKVKMSELNIYIESRGKKRH